jgi:hypothetical protein
MEDRLKDELFNGLKMKEEVKKVGVTSFLIVSSGQWFVGWRKTYMRL